MMEPDTRRTQHSATDTMRDVTDASKQIFAAGQRIAEDLDELESRVQRATDWRAQYNDHPALILAAAFVGGLLLSTLVTPRR